MAATRKFWKKLIESSGYTVTRLHAKKNPQLERQITSKHFFDLYFSMVDPATFFFVQLGAYDGKYRDPLYRYITTYQLPGILVEPQKEAFERLRETYKNQSNLTFANVAISHKSGTQTLYKVKESLVKDNSFWDSTSISSLDKEITKRMLKKRIPHVIEYVSDNLDDYIEETTVTTLTFEDFTREYRIKKIDYLQTDCEGYDYTIVSMFDFNTYSPRIINYESLVFSDETRKKCEALLESKGYQIFRHGIDTCAFRV